MYREGLAEFAAAQSALRRTWAEDDIAIWGDMAGGVGTDALEIDAFPTHKGLVLVARDLWKFICILFLDDYRTGKIGVCENPDCLAPYFLKKRCTQKICEAGACTAWAQRRYALRWWHKKKESERNKKRKK